MQKEYDFSFIENEKRRHEIIKNYKRLKIMLYFAGQYKKRKFLLDNVDKLKDMRNKYRKLQEYIIGEKLFYDTFVNNNVLVDEANLEEKVLEKDAPSTSLNNDKNFTDYKKESDILKQIFPDLFVEHCKNNDKQKNDESVTPSTTKNVKTNVDSSNNSIDLFDPLIQDPVYTGTPEIINDLQILILSKEKKIGYKCDFIKNKDFCEYLLTPYEKRNFKFPKLNPSQFPEFSTFPTKEINSDNQNDEDEEYDEKCILNIIEEFNKYSLKYALFITDLLSYNNVNDKISIINPDSIDDRLIFKPIPTESNLSRIVNYYYKDEKDDKKQKTNLDARNKHLFYMIIQLNDDVIEYEKNHPFPVYSEDKKIDNTSKNEGVKKRLFLKYLDYFFKSKKGLNLGSKNRCLGLWLWDQCKNPFSNKNKPDVDYFLKAVKFRFDTDQNYKQKFLENNNLLTFPDTIDKEAPYIENEIRDMRKLLKNANDSIEQMKIVPLRVETDQQKQTRKLKQSLGLKK